MRRKLLLITLIIVALISLFAFTNVVKAAEPSFDENTGYILNGTQKCFFANGTPISIEARDDGQSGATIFWEGGTKHVDVPNDINVFGGSHATTDNHDSTEITMNGGTVKNIFGGGLHESSVTTSNVTVNDGTVTGSVVGGGANVLANSDVCQPTNVTAENSPTRVSNANVTVNNGTVNMVYGGGEGLGYTGKAVVKINGGNFQYVTAGGSNGYTGNAEVKITSGNVNLLQSVNRGNVNLADMRVSGGTINKLYVGGEDDNDVTGTIDTISLDITGGSVVNNLYIGRSGGRTIGADTSVDIDIYLGATVNIANESEFANIPITEYVFVTIDDNRYELEKGKTLADLAELEDIKNVQGMKFVNFVIKDTEEIFNEDTVINGDIALNAVYTKIEKPMDNTPKTGEDSIGEIWAITMILWSIIGISIMRKIKE